MNRWIDINEDTIGIKYKLYGEHKTLLFDKEDYDFLNRFTFKLCSNGYVQCRQKLAKGRYYMIHNLLINTPDGKEIDHINSIKWDNRKNNLRICTHSQNQRNKSTKKKYLGVYRDNFTIHSKGRYYAQIKYNGKNKHIAYCNTEKEAAIAYNKAAKMYYGEFAKLNVVE